MSAEGNRDWVRRLLRRKDPVFAEILEQVIAELEPANIGTSETGSDHEAND